MRFFHTKERWLLVVVSEVLSLFRTDYIAVRCLSNSTDENYCDAMTNFIKHMGDMDIKDIDPQTVVQWRKKMERTMKSSCVRCYLSKLKNILIFSNKRALTMFDISEFHLPKVAQSLPKYLRPEEIEAMMNHAGSLRNRCIISFLFTSGIRSSELKNLDTTDVQGSQVYIRQGKGNTSRTVYISGSSKQLLEQYLAERTDRSNILFYSQQHGRLGINQVRGIIKLAALEAGIERNVTTHMMRHSFATTMIRQGADISYVQRLLGHQFVSTTQIYIHIENDELKMKHAEVFS